jgi:hypothetical protein
LIFPTFYDKIKEKRGDPYLDDTEGNSFMTQTTYAFKLEGKDTYIHMAERHNKENFLHCSYVWLPVSFIGDRLEIKYLEEYKIGK